MQMAVVQTGEDGVIGGVDDLRAGGARVGVELVDRADGDDAVAVDENGSRIERVGDVWDHREDDAVADQCRHRASVPGREKPVNSAGPCSRDRYERRHYARCMVSARHPLLRALEPVADSLGAELVGPRHVRAGDIPLEWEGVIVGGPGPGMQGSLERMMAAVEQELGGRACREQKQLAVRMLDDRGAFALRRSVESVADAMGVSRFTIYNYLNAAG